MLAPRVRVFVTWLRIAFAPASSPDTPSVGTKSTGSAWGEGGGMDGVARWVALGGPASAARPVGAGVCVGVRKWLRGWAARDSSAVRSVSAPSGADSVSRGASVRVWW